LGFCISSRKGEDNVSEIVTSICGGTGNQGDNQGSVCH
jgi:hypothetical protein